MDFIQLKKCPFCGSNATRVRHPGGNGVEILQGKWFVGCPSEFFGHCCEVSQGAKWYNNLEEAETDWNKRK